jgi:hypothetical protein
LSGFLRFRDHKRFILAGDYRGKFYGQIGYYLWSGDFLVFIGKDQIPGIYQASNNWRYFYITASNKKARDRLPQKVITNREPLSSEYHSGMPLEANLLTC